MRSKGYAIEFEHEFCSFKLHLQKKRFHNWLENARDWAISQSRFWGTPLPLWISEDGDEVIVVDSVDKLEKLSGVKVQSLLSFCVFLCILAVMVSLGRLRVPLEVCEKKKCSNCLENACTKWYWGFIILYLYVLLIVLIHYYLVFDLHCHNIDHIAIPSSRGPEFGVLHRVEDVFDCWFESGSMPCAYIHYPFENVELFEKNFPGNFVAEGLDQTCGWLVPNLFRSLGTQ
ncbi:hypothetical protein Pint_05420 [Pistacia integerrima]|uniref:Uncharacterized protein n=1 Tax=Pistacia integerrima TaxID=434235 RepID=A0ACC0Z3H2_9ROSI|nr:hypothetical protein Pint_05420 [Pistacia integerrima]